jgi:hypothetical protein
LHQDYSVAGLSDVGRRHKRNVIDSWDSGAAYREVNIHSTEHDWIHVQNKGTGLPPRNIPSAVNGDNRHLLILRGCWVSRAHRQRGPRERRGLRSWRWRGPTTAPHLGDRTHKHEHQAEANNDFVNHFYFHIAYFPFTEVLQEIRPDITRKVSIFLQPLIDQPSQSYGSAGANEHK